MQIAKCGIIKDETYLVFLDQFLFYYFHRVSSLGFLQLHRENFRITSSSNHFDKLKIIQCQRIAIHSGIVYRLQKRVQKDEKRYLTAKCRQSNLIISHLPKAKHGISDDSQP